MPDLKPEKSKSMDVGIDQSFFDGRIKVSGGYFWNRYTNLIQFVFAPPIIGLTNIGQAQSKGYEVSVSAQVLKWLEIHGQYTRTMTRDLSQNIGARLPQWPVDSASAGLTVQPLDALRLGLDYRYVGARTNSFPLAQMDSFHVVSGSVSYDVMKQIQIYGRIENAFNARYEELLNFGTPSLSLFGGIKASYELPI
jgi:vitamin B12 transporter